MSYSTKKRAPLFQTDAAKARPQKIIMATESGFGKSMLAEIMVFPRDHDHKSSNASITDAAREGTATAP